MADTLAATIRKIVARLQLPTSADIKVFDKETEQPIHRKTLVKTPGLSKFIANLDPNIRVASFLNELEERMGVQIGARFELYVAGDRIDGRSKVLGLR